MADRRSGQPSKDVKVWHPNERNKEMQTLLILIHGFNTMHNHHALLNWDVHHGAVKFLLSGQTSASPANRCQALQDLRWFVSHGWAPQDW
jgi:hypothetical protein